MHIGLTKTLQAFGAAALWVGVLLVSASAQDPPPVASTEGVPPPQNTISYVLGSGDAFSISLADAKELTDQFSSEFVIDSDGYVTIPLIGRLRPSGQTVIQFQEQVAEGLRKYVREPQVYVTVRTLKSQTVSVLGAVNTPGVHQVSGPKRLAEVLALAGGLAKDSGYKITITRSRRWGAIPLPGAVIDATGEYCTAEVNVRALTEANSPQDNILIRPDDVITVPRAQVVYVIGEVRKSGGFTLGDEKTMSLLQALSLAEGMTRTASPSRATILRLVPASPTRTEIKVDLKKLLGGKAKDVALNASDILFVPDNSTRRVGWRVAETAMQTLSGLIIWRGL